MVYNRIKENSIIGRLIHAQNKYAADADEQLVGTGQAGSGALDA